MTDCLTMLNRLGRDNAGNTLAIAAASLIPMMALIGGGVDISRAYMAKTQLQSACDSGVLAGRKALSKSGSYGENEKAKANSMFNFNFNGAALNMAQPAFTTVDNDDGQVSGTATAAVPTLMMKIFNKDTVDLSVDCMAELQIGNADIMFVLDVTTSMNDSLGKGEPSKLSGLREAVKDFHKTINQAINDNRTRVRYGFVPYAMTVNASELLSSGAMPYDYFTDSTNYQSRIAVFDKPIYVGTPKQDPRVERRYTSGGKDTKISRSDCDTFVNQKASATGGPPPKAETTTVYSQGSERPSSRTKNYCSRYETTTKTTYVTKYEFRHWRYQKVPLNTSDFRSFSSVPIATKVDTSVRFDAPREFNLQQLASISGTGPQSLTWNGCIEERDTVTETDFDPIPDEAFDLDFDLVPDSDATRWKPMWSNVEFTRSNYTSETSTSTSKKSVTGYCPSAMKLFQTVDLSDNPNHIPSWLNTYLANLNVAGYTYHDIGMIWGGRLTSPTGMFAENVNLDADRINVSKHIIFMTDGILQPESGQYSAYGIEDLDSRIAPKGSAGTIYARHMARFSAVCEAIKAQGTTIWVVAFGTSMTTELQNCATGGRAYYSSNTQALSNTFKYIAAQVADLRLGA